MPRDTKINKIDIKSYPLPWEPHEDIPKIQRKLLSPKEINCPTSPMTTICVEDKRTFQTESKMQSASSNLIINYEFNVIK